MECNKEEALRARGIAEKKMETGDFFVAKKFASRAQQLYPDLENLMQIVSVCDVHCSAENKVYENEKDWYGILNVEPTADDALIRKQYRKLALLLHPDKNKFPGAADAFKLIGEAQMVLLDYVKRTSFNGRRISSPTSQVPMEQPHIRKQKESMNQQGSQSGVPNSLPTFWTACSFCSVRFKYYKTLLNKLLSCHNCKKSYTAYELNTSDAATPASKKKNDATNQCHAKVSSQSACMSSASNQNKTDETLAKSEIPSDIRQEFNTNGNPENAYEKMNKEGVSGEYKKKNTKKRKTLAESSENSDSSSSIETEENSNFKGCSHLPEQNSQRRSTRSRQHVAYSGNLSAEDEEYSPSKQSNSPPTEEFEVQNLSHNGKKKKLTGSSPEESFPKAEQEAVNAHERVVVPEKDSGQTFDLPSDVGASTMAEPEIFECPNPDFSDFDKGREESHFKLGQVWALYDTLDAMPRFYAVITKIFSPAFKVCMTWFELDPLDEDGTKWVSAGLPASCGRFRLGNSEYTEDHFSFSHLVCASIQSSCNMLKIFPREGETWAIFNDWDIKWSSHLDSKRNYSYEFVEILSDYADDIGVRVAYLGKVKGFTCLFHRAATKLGKRDPFLIPANEILRFSHRVPSFKMTGMERSDVPEGSFELDPASLPECILSPAHGMEMRLKSEGDTSSVGPKDKPQGNAHLDDWRSSTSSGNNSLDSAENSVPSVVAIDVPDSEFYKFDADRTPEKFQVGQFWAIYSDEDGMPRYYGQIMKLDPGPNFALHVVWLYACLPAKGIIRWHDRNMPIGCGMFKFKDRKLHKYTGTSVFSHQVGAEAVDKKGVYTIFPRKGEVWAVYKNWSAAMKCDKLEDCEYEIVEIVDVSNGYIHVKFLARVNGFRTVYKPRVEEEDNGTLKISVAEQLRFSHQIPTFRLTEERGGSLRDLLELEPAATPQYLLCVD